MLDLDPFYFKLRVDALFSCSQALNRADFEAERQTSPNFEPPTSNAIPNFKSTGKLRVDASQGCFQALNRADFQFRAAANFESRISSCRHRISAPPNFNQAANFFGSCIRNRRADEVGYLVKRRNALFHSQCVGLFFAD